MSTMPHKTRIAIIGYGRFGRIHARRVRVHPAFEIVCVVDPLPHARDAAHAAGFKAFARLQDMPRGVEVAAVVTPYDTHAEVAIRLMRMGIDVLVEKPLAATERDIDALLEAECTSRRLLCTGHVERFNECLSMLPWTHTPQSLAFTRCSSASSGSRSIALDLMVHDLDTASLLLGGKDREAFTIVDVRQRDQRLDAQVICGTPMNFSAWHGAPSSDARLSWQETDVRHEFSLRQPMSPDGVDALTLQYTAFQERLHGARTHPAIASAADGAAAARRAIAIESWL